MIVQGNNTTTLRKGRLNVTMFLKITAIGLFKFFNFTNRD